MESGRRDSKEYWFSELDLLGIRPKRTNELKDSREMRDLVENVSQTMYQDYRSACTE